MTDRLPNVIGDAGYGIEATPMIQVSAEGLVLGSHYQQTGTINGPGDEITLVCPGCASAVIDFAGTFAGTLEVVGMAHPESPIESPRNIFKNGVGSIGNHSFALDGTYSDEWLVVSHGYSITFRCTSYTSGSLEVAMSASAAPSLLLVNGPVQNADEQALRAGNGYVGATGIVQVTQNNVLDVVLSNPSDSGVNLIIERRRFGNASTSVLEYQAFQNPTALDTPITGSRNNRLIGAPVSAASLTYQLRTTATAMGGTAGTGEVLPAGNNNIRELLSILPPGNRLGYRVSGAGSNLSQAARLSVTLEWYEEPLP